MWLSKEELYEMTEAGTRPLQIEWLKKHRIPFTQGRHGKLNVLRALVYRKHGLVVDDEAPDTYNYEAFQ
jgi:hypothetical protein